MQEGLIGKCDIGIERQDLKRKDIKGEGEGVAMIMNNG
jgi:hypothetical protein